jgi:hypothetical protein
MALIDFDEARKNEDRDFVIRGQTFTIQRVRPEVMNEIEQLDRAFLEVEEPTYSDVVTLAENRLCLLIDDHNGAVDRWRELRAREEDPVEYGEIMAISRKAFELVSGLPTMPPVASTGGDGTTDSSSTGGSS